MALTDVVSAQDYDDLYACWENQKASLVYDGEVIENLERELAIAAPNWERIENLKRACDEGARRIRTLEDTRNATLEELRLAQCVNSQLRAKLAVAVTAIPSPSDDRDLFVDLLQSQVAHLKETLSKERLNRQPSGPSEIERRLSALEEKLMADKELPRHYNDVVGKLCDIRKTLDATQFGVDKLLAIRKVLDR